MFSLVSRKFLAMCNIALYSVSFFESAIFQKKNIICFIPMKISPNLYGKMDVSKFWCFHWFPENSLLCVILCYTVYVWIAISSPTFSRIFCILLPLEFAINFLLFFSDWKEQTLRLIWSLPPATVDCIFAFGFTTYINVEKSC